MAAGMERFRQADPKKWMRIVYKYIAKRHLGKPPADALNRTGPSGHRASDVTGQGEHCTEFNKEQARIFKAASPLAVTRLTVARPE